MKFLPLVWSGLWRKKLRTILTFLSIVVLLDAPAAFESCRLFVTSQPQSNVDVYRESELRALQARNINGRLVAVVLSPRAFASSVAAGAAGAKDRQWGEKHMIPAELARAARILNRPGSVDEE